MKIPAVIIVLALGPGMAAAPAQEPIGSLEELRSLRQEAAERQRRIIFNNDGNEPVYLCTDTTPEELLKQRTAPLAGSQVDSLFYCTWSSGFGLFTHGTKVGQVFSTKEAMFSKNMTPELLAAGTDPLRVMVEFGHENDMEVFWSFRLNDTHDGSRAEYGPIMFRANKLKNEHPEWLIGTPEARPKYGAWSAVDFTRDEIRELAFRYVEEVCRNYDVDGVELDFFRHPVFFKRAAMSGTECTQAERARMTELIERIRTMTETVGMERGRPILVAMRVPDSVEYCRAVGLDLEKWLADGQMDLLIASGYFQLNDWSYSVDLGRRYGVKVYPSFDESRVKDPESRSLRRAVGAYRGRALNARQAGTDGVYLFNSFDPTSPLWRELGSPETLATMDQDYFASVRGLGAAAGGAYPHADFLRIPDLNPARPVAVEPGTPARVSFRVGDDYAAKAPADQPTIRLRLRFKAPVTADGVAVKLNGTALPAGEVEDDWLVLAVPPEQLKPGANQVEVSTTQSGPANALTDLHCPVRYGNR
ncbi:MAG: family 10 glycosylhydrolase [Verrucomicrobiales bacterium]